MPMVLPQVSLGANNADQKAMKRIQNQWDFMMFKILLFDGHRSKLGTSLLEATVYE